MPPHQRKRSPSARAARGARRGRGGQEPRVPPVDAVGPGGRSVTRMLVLSLGGVLALGLVAFGLVVLVRGSAGTTGCDPDPKGWNGDGGGPAHTGRASISIRDPGRGWAPSWSYPAASAPASDDVTAPPAAAGGTVYTATAKGTLVALDAQRGTRRWTSEPGAGEEGAVAVPIALDGCGAVLGASFDGPDGQPAGALRAVDLRTHSRRWGIPAADHVFSAPEVVQGVAYAGLALPASTGSLDRTHVLDGYYLSDGSLGYRKRFTAGVLASPASDGTRIWIGDLDQDVYALGPQGKQLWSYTTGGIVAVAAVWDGASVEVMSADHHLSSLDPSRGTERWNVEVGDVQAGMALVPGGIAVATIDGTVSVRASADGHELWHRDLGARVSHALTSAGDRLFAVDDDGTVHVLDAGSGAETASWTAPAPPTGPPAIAEGHLYLTCQDGRLYALPL